jgi:hypothetical protein
MIDENFHITETSSGSQFMTQEEFGALHQQSWQVQDTHILSLDLHLLPTKIFLMNHIDQLSPLSLVKMLDGLKSHEKDLLFVAHQTCKQPRHLLSKLKNAMHNNGALGQDGIDVLTVRKGSRKADVHLETATKLYYRCGLTLWQTAWLNPVPVTQDDVREALGLSLTYYRKSRRLKYNKPLLTQLAIDTIKSLPHVNYWRAAAIFAVPGSSPQRIQQLVDIFR